MYKYETHLHTFPVSKCAKAEVLECMEFYKEMGYDGIFITNHFIDGSINISSALPYTERIEFCFSDYEKALNLAEKIGIKVFCGIESSYKGTDFLVYGLDKDWFLENPQIMDMKKKEQLLYFMENGALVIQAHPFREASYIDHIRLFPRYIHGVEVVNTNRKDEENKIAKIYAEHYELIEFAGSDNHTGKQQKKLAGMCSKKAVIDEQDFICKIKNGEMCIFTMLRQCDL